MTPAQARSPNRHRRRGRSEANAGGGQREVNYRQLRNPFMPQTVFSDDQITAMHNEALSVLAESGIKVLLPEARMIFAAGGALVDEDTEVVRIGREIVETHTPPPAADPNRLEALDTYIARRTAESGTAPVS